MHWQKMASIIFLTAYALVLSACVPSNRSPRSPGDTPASPPASGEHLAGMRWTLVSLGKIGQETPVIEGSNVTLAFQEDGQMGGSGGCNSYGGQYQIEGDSITFHEIASTLMACGDQAVTDQEAQYLEAIRNTGRFATVDNRLDIYYDNDGSVLRFTNMVEVITTTAKPSSTTDAGLIPTGPDEKHYTLTAETSQTITVEITSDGAPLSLIIKTPSGIERFPEVTQAGSGFRINHIFIATETGAYEFTLAKADHTPSTNYTVSLNAQ